MKSQTRGTSTSEVELLNINVHGFWLYVKGKEYFLSYEAFPWFRDAKLSQLFEVELLHQYHLHWPQLDIDLDIASLEAPDRYPLIYR
jgi:hypothetical protein